MKCVVEVNNMPNQTEKYVVARYSEDTNSLWFWGSWEDEDKAEAVAEEIGGLVLERGE